MRRHPEIAIHEPENVTAVRACVTEGATRGRFEKARNYLSSHEGSAFEQIMADPRRILNTDETSFSLCPKSGKVLGPKGWRNVYDLKRGNEKDTLTVLATFSADGKVVPGMIVYPYQRVPREVVASVPPPWAIGLSDSGWMKSDTFYEYIVNVLDFQEVARHVACINEFLAAACSGLEHIAFWKHRGMWQEGASIFRQDGVHFNPRGSFKLYKSVRGAVMRVYFFRLHHAHDSIVARILVFEIGLRSNHRGTA